MDSYLKIGCNFDESIPKLLNELNKDKNGIYIDEVYGSIKEHSWLTARPSFRLPDISENELREYIKRLKEIDIRFNYTLNTSTIGSKSEIYEKQDYITEQIKMLIDIGVDTFTVTLPYVAGMIRKINNNVGICVSTIANLESITQINVWFERYGINKVCSNLSKNRDIRYLENAANFCNRNNIDLELMVNEFCGCGTANSGVAHCIYRNHCYYLHSTDYTIGDSKKLDDYPMSCCISSRDKGEVWLKLNYIRPEDIKLYNDIGINHFKITGRTANYDYLKRVITAYKYKLYNGNLLDLWKHLQTITDVKEEEYKSDIYIDNRKLDGFLDFWFKNKGHLCYREVCGESCSYCDNYYKIYILGVGPKLEISCNKE